MRIFDHFLKTSGAVWMGKTDLFAGPGLGQNWPGIDQSPIRLKIEWSADPI